MNVAAAGGASTYQVPTNVQAKANDERTESTATKVREAESGKEAAAPVQSNKLVNLLV